MGRRRKWRGPTWKRERDAIEQWHARALHCARVLDAHERARARATAERAEECREACAFVACAVNARQLSECAARLFRWPRSPREWLVATRGDHDADFANLQDNEGRDLGLVQLLQLRDDLGQFRTWRARLVLARGAACEPGRLLRYRKLC